MREDELIQDIALIGLGGAGIRTVLALRAQIADDSKSVVGDSTNTCRLLAIDSNYSRPDYFQYLDEKEHDHLLLSQSEYLGLLRPGENPWDKVSQDAKSNIPEASRLLDRRVFPIGMAAPVRSDYQAMIYVSRKRMRQAIESFLKISSALEKNATKTKKVIVATSLIGDAGSVSFLELLDILSAISEEIKNLEIYTVLIGPDFLKYFFQVNRLHIARYLSMINSLDQQNLNGHPKYQFPLNYLVSAHVDASIKAQLDGIEIYFELAKKVMIQFDFGTKPRTFVFNETENPFINLDHLNNEKILEISKFYAGQLMADPSLVKLLRDLSH